MANFKGIFTAQLTPFDKKRPDLPREVFEQVEINLKYEGYIKRELAEVARQRKEKADYGR